MARLAYRKLKRKGQCICCGNDITTDQKVIRIDYPHISQVYGVSICKDCIKEFNKLIKNDTGESECLKKNI